MAGPGNSCIWRATTSGAEDSNTSDRIQFNESPIPYNGKQITQSEFEMKVSLALNERPKQKLDELQDTGLSSVTVVVTGSSFVPTDEASTGPFQLAKKWMIEDKWITAFPKGRFGLRINDFPHYNVTPTVNLGYMIEDWRWIREGEWKGRAAFVATLRLNGSVGSPPYSWG